MVAGDDCRIPLHLPPGVVYVGLLGGIGSGKSSVAREFAKRGAAVIDADRIAREVLEDPDIRRAIEQRWGLRVLDKEGKPDRRAIASIVFGLGPTAAEERRFLERLLHPRVAARIEQEARRLAEAGCRVVVLDVPLLAEVGWVECCQLLVLVDTPAEVCWQRLRDRGWTWSEFVRRQCCQWPVERKKQLADAVIDNSGPPERLSAQVAQIWQTVIDRLPASQ